MAMELLGSIDAQYPKVIDIADIFLKSSVIDMAEYIESKLGISEKTIDTDDRKINIEETGFKDILEQVDLVEQAKN